MPIAGMAGHGKGDGDFRQEMGPPLHRESYAEGCWHYGEEMDRL